MLCVVGDGAFLPFHSGLFMTSVGEQHDRAEHLLALCR
jgi:hypothetical protein